jgi:glycosyltransferase involved in cell wall biosynthesis
MKKIVHLVPVDTVGGVENMANSITPSLFRKADFSVEFISNMKNRNNPIFFIKMVHKLAYKDQVDLLIVSLWRSLIVGIMAKAFNSKIKLVVFLHSTKDFHWLENIVTKISFKLAEEIWADSHTTIQCRVKKTTDKNKSRVIFPKLNDISPFQTRNVTAEFIFWGRLSAEKDIGNTLTIFHGIYRNNKSARLTVVGPDNGEKLKLQEICVKLKINKAVHFTGVLNFSEIEKLSSKASFYIQTSLFEGASMSVVEAMQFGLVPIVTPVGEIKEYCIHKENSLIVSSKNKAVNDILFVINNNNIYQNLRSVAINTWVDVPLYQESVFKACKQLLNIK